MPMGLYYNLSLTLPTPERRLSAFLFRCAIVAVGLYLEQGISVATAIEEDDSYVTHIVHIVQRAAPMGRSIPERGCPFAFGALKGLVRTRKGRQVESRILVERLVTYIELHLLIRSISESSAGILIEHQLVEEIGILLVVYNKDLRERSRLCPPSVVNIATDNSVEQIRGWTIVRCIALSHPV